MAKKLISEASESITESTRDASRLTDPVISQATVLAAISSNAVTIDASAAIINRRCSRRFSLVMNAFR